MRFTEEQDTLPLFTKVYQELKKRNLPFADESSVNINSDVSSPSKSGLKPEVDEKVVHFKKPLDKKHQKVKEDLMVVLNNVILANEMIDATEEGDDIDGNEAITDVMNSIKSMEQKLQELIIIKIKNEDLMNMCLLLNDDVQKTIQRHKKARRGRDPGTFQRQCRVDGEKVEEHKKEEPEITIPPRKQAQKHAEQRAAPSKPSAAPEKSLFDVFASDPQQDPNANQQPAQSNQPTQAKNEPDLFDMDFGGASGAPVAQAQPAAPEPPKNDEMISKLNSQLNNMNLEKQKEEEQMQMRMEMEKQATLAA